MEMTWQEIAKIITIYEMEVEAGNISRYGSAKDIQHDSEIILDKYQRLNKQ